jgi:hypothetical protein
MHRAVTSGILVAAAIAGIAHGRVQFARDREEAIEAAARARREAPAPEPPPRPPQPAPAPPLLAPPSAPPAAPRPKEPDLAAARAALHEAEDAHAHGRYRDEAALYAKARDLVKEDDGVESAALRKLAARFAARALILACLRERVQPNEFADGKGLTRIVYLDHEYVVRVLSQDEKEAVMRTASGVELRLAVGDIQKAEALPADEWRRRVEKGLAERREKVDEESALELYHLAYYCLENGLVAEAAPWLEKAFEHDRENVLLSTFCTGPDRPSAAEAQLARGEAAAPRRVRAPAVAPAEPAPDAAPRPAEPAPEAALRADARYRDMVAKLEEGRDHYRLSYGTGKRADDELRVATGIFDQAFDLVVVLQSDFPDSEEVGARLTEISLIRADCHKRTKVGR